MQFSMKMIVNLPSLYDVLRTQKEIVLYPVGVEGNEIVDLFWFTNVFRVYYHRVCCIAAAKLENDNARRFIHSIPVIQMADLPHMRESAAFIVAASPQSRETIGKYLVQFGCKNVFLLSDDTLKEVHNNLQTIYASGQYIRHYFDHICNQLEDMRYFIAEQNETCALNSETFSPFRNRFRGKKVVIFATGPTSQYYKPIPDAIHIGLNYAWKNESIPLNYLFTTDSTVKLSMVEGFDKITDEIFIGKVMDRIPWSWLIYPEEVSLKWKNVHRFFIEDNTGYPIYQDICCHPVMGNSSVVFSALHFALFTYPKEIYLVGCDVGSVYDHFYDQDDKTPKEASGFPNGDKVKVLYARMKMFNRKYYPETKIISINPVGLRGLFQDVYTDNYPDKPKN